jgi:G3E family GTPase
MYKEHNHPTATHDEVETITIYRGPTGQDDGIHTCDGNSYPELNGVEFIEENVLTNALESLSKETVYRVKGLVRLARGVHIVNWAFGRYELTQIDEEMTATVTLTVMGERGGGVKVCARKLSVALGVTR